MRDALSELSFSFTIVESASLIELELLIVPFDDEILIENFLVIHELHESARELDQVRIFPYEVLDDGLKQVSDTDLAILGHKL